MKNKTIKIIVIFTFLLGSFGCSYIDRYTNSSSNSNKTVAEKGVDDVSGEKKIGVKECDDLMDQIERDNKKQDDNFISEAARRVFANEIRDKVRKNIEENKKDPAKQAQECKQYQEQYDKYFKDANSNTKKSIWFLD